MHRNGEALWIGGVTRRTRDADAPVLAALERFAIDDVAALGAQTSMCGLGALRVLMHACAHLGFTRTELLGYLVNTEVTACDSTTGFAAAVFRP